MHDFFRCNDAGAASAPPPVTVTTPIRKEIVEWDEYTGRTEAIESVDVRPRVSGYIDQISFNDGQLVKPGDVLFVIDQRPYQDVLDQAKANLQDAEALRPQYRPRLTSSQLADYVFQVRMLVDTDINFQHEVKPKRNANSGKE